MSSFFVWIWLSLFRLILKLIHFTYSGYEFFDSGWLLLKRKCTNLLHLSIFDSQKFVSDFVKNLDKCPSHLVVIVGEDGIDLRDFSNLVVWCLAAKISFISFYDYSGHLKKEKYVYYQFLVDKRKIDPNCVIFDLEKLNMKDGILHKIYINILSLQDGKPLFVDVAKRLGQSVISNNLKISEINEKIIASELYKFNGLPDPDLGIVCGKIFGTFGFLPWNIRVTEFLQVKNICGIKAWEFTSILLAYSSCSQRFGK